MKEFHDDCCYILFHAEAVLSRRKIGGRIVIVVIRVFSPNASTFNENSHRVKKPVPTLSREQQYSTAEFLHCSLTCSFEL
jgi:hypothetical protein